MPQSIVAHQRKLQQRINRERLKLARLKTLANKKRQLDTRMKLRLGGFLYLLDWQDLPTHKLSEHLAEVSEQLINASPSEIDQYTIHGQSRWHQIARDKTDGSAKPGRDPEQRKAENHKKITLGGLMVKFDLHTWHRATVLGALATLNQELEK